MIQTRSTTWNCHSPHSAACTSPDRDDMTKLRCAILVVLEHGRWMAADEIPLPEIPGSGGAYLRRLSESDDVIRTPVPAREQWARLDAEVRLLVARAAGLDAVTALDPCIKRVLGNAARRTPHRQMDLLDFAAEQLPVRRVQPPRTN